MHPAQFAVFIAVGLLVGFTAGLVGIGGGVLMVPFLYFIYDGFGPAWGWTLPERGLRFAFGLFLIATAIQLAIGRAKAEGHIVGLDLRRVASTSLAIIVFAATAGSAMRTRHRAMEGGP